MKIVPKFILIFVIGMLGTLLSCKSNTLYPADSTGIEATYFIKGQFKSLKVDNLGNIFVVNNRNVISKFSEEGILLFEFSLNRLGDIYSVDVSNPQKILIYYGDYNYIVFVDNTMSEMTRLSLEEYGYWNIPAVCTSREGNIWMFDPIENLLLKIDENGNVLLNSNELYYTVKNKIKNPRLFEFEKNLYLASENKVYRFDNFGHLLHSYDVPNERCQYFENRFAYLKQDTIYTVTTMVELVKQSETIFSGESIKDFHIASNKIYVLDHNGISIHSF